MCLQIGLIPFRGRRAVCAAPKDDPKLRPGPPLTLKQLDSTTSRIPPPTTTIQAHNTSTDTQCPTYSVTDYDWQILQEKPKTHLVDAVLSVVFDAEAQRQFSSVRIRLCCKQTVTESIRAGWNIASAASSLTVRTHSQDKSVVPNADSLPVFHATFDIVPSDSALSAEQDPVAEIGLIGPVVEAGIIGPGYELEPLSMHLGIQALQDKWQLSLREGSHYDDDSLVIIEFDQVLTEEMEAVFVSFICSRSLLFSRRRNDGISNYLLMPTNVGRVVRVSPMIPPHKRNPISLPRDVLLVIFSTIPSPAYTDWRKDLLSCARVCRMWTCALEFLLTDFQSENWKGSPPEITKFAGALSQRPSLGLWIQHLSQSYFLWHPAWVVHRGQRNERLPLFSEAFVSILGLARNLKSLSLGRVAYPYFRAPPDRLFDALHGLNRLEILHVQDLHSLTVSQIISCIPTSPSLKSLLISNHALSSTHILPLTSQWPLPTFSCALTSLHIINVAIKDDELLCLTSSSPSLRTLQLDATKQITNAGLLSALRSVSKSLVWLSIQGGVFQRGAGEERALDTIITDMERLESLKMAVDLATTLMLQRRRRAFERSTRHASLALPKLTLTLYKGAWGSDIPEETSLLAVADTAWPGWNILKDRSLRSKPFLW